MILLQIYYLKLRSFKNVKCHFNNVSQTIKYFLTLFIDHTLQNFSILFLEKKTTR